jgi:exopolyphosphatase/guanosine-5'-triphosphate,3'-diphosphate pyrophosphatase
MIEKDDCHDGTSLPLGTLRLPKLRAAGTASFNKAVRKAMGKAGWAAAHPGPLYMVGGTWRAFAAFAMHRDKFPVTDPHGFQMDVESADRLAKKISRMQVAELASISGISSSRAYGLPDAAAMLRVMISELKPDGLVFSSWGLREGLLHQKLGDAAKRQDPFLAAMDHFTTHRGGSASLAAMIAGWTADAAAGHSRESERLRLAATMLALSVARVEPNLRRTNAYLWAMEKRWVNLSHAGRAQLASAMLAFCGKPNIFSDLLRLTNEPALHESAGWGLAIRLCRRLGAGSRNSLMASGLIRENDRFVLWIEEDHAQLAGGQTQADLKALAQWYGLEHEIRIGRPIAEEADESGSEAQLELAPKRAQAG